MGNKQTKNANKDFSFCDDSSMQIAELNTQCSEVMWRDHIPFRTFSQSLSRSFYHQRQRKTNKRVCLCVNTDSLAMSMHSDTHEQTNTIVSRALWSGVSHRFHLTLLIREGQTDRGDLCKAFYQWRKARKAVPLHFKSPSNATAFSTQGFHAALDPNVQEHISPSPSDR